MLNSAHKFLVDWYKLCLPMPITLVLFLLLLLLFQWNSWYHAVFPDSHESFHGCWSLVLDHELWLILFVTGEGRKRDSQGRVKKTEGKGGEWSRVKSKFAFFSTMLETFKGFYDKIRHFLSSCAASWSKFDLSSADETFSISKSKSYTL